MKVLQIAMKMLESNEDGLNIITMQYDKILNCWKISIGKRGYFNKIVITEHEEKWEKCYKDRDDHFSNDNCSVDLQLGLLSNDYHKLSPQLLIPFFNELVEKIKQEN